MTDLCRTDGCDPGRHMMPEYFDTSFLLDSLSKKCQLELQSSWVSTIFRLGKLIMQRIFELLTAGEAFALKLFTW